MESLGVAIKESTLTKDVAKTVFEYAHTLSNCYYIDGEDSLRRLSAVSHMRRTQPAQRDQEDNA